MGLELSSPFFFTMKKIKVIFENDNKRFGYVVDVENQTYHTSPLNEFGEPEGNSEPKKIKDKKIIAQQLYMVLLNGLEK